MHKPPYDQRVARLLVGSLARCHVTPNQVTALTLVLALLAAWLFARGEPHLDNWAAGLFVLARFLDHFDGELARATGRASRLGYYFDYLSGAVSYAALFIGIAIGAAQGPIGPYAWVLGAAGAASALISLGLNLDLDRQQDMAEGAAIGYPGIAGFELEDGIYLLAPITWLGWLSGFFVAAGSGATVYCLWTLLRVVRVRAARAA